MHILTVEPTTPLLRKTGCIPCWYCGFTVISSPCALFLMFITVTTTYNPCPNFGCYILCLIHWLALSPTLYANRKGGLFLLYLPARILSLQCLLTFDNCKSLYKTTSKQSLVYDQNFIVGGGGGTVKEAWVKAKVVCRKKEVQMVLSSLLSPPPPPPIFPYDKNLHHADCLKFRLSTSNRNR